MTPPATTPLKYLDKALGVLRNLGLIKSEPQAAPIVALIDRIAHLEPDQAAAIARTLSQASLFNEVVREQIQAMQIGERYRGITGAFDSIRDDARRMVDQMADNKIDTFERLSNIWMKVTRGDIPSRFAKIKTTYLDVAKDTKDQIQREQTILEAYRDFRTALKEAQVLGFGGSSGVHLPADVWTTLKELRELMGLTAPFPPGVRPEDDAATQSTP